jgi:hypothetical protein
MAQRSLDLIEAMRAVAEVAQPITGRGVGDNRPTTAFQLDLFGLPERIGIAPGGTVVRSPHRRAAPRRRKPRASADAVQLEFEFPLTFATEPVAHNAADIADNAAYRRLHFGYSRDQ